MTQRKELSNLRNIDDFSDYIVFVDESGDHNLTSIDEYYPVFVLSFCLFAKKDYAETVCPAIRNLKFRTFGHDMIVLHESDIRRKKGAFSSLSKEPRETFLGELTKIIDEANFKLIAIVIDKRELTKRYIKPSHPYHLALGFGLECIYRFLTEMGQHKKRTHIVCEARGAKEDGKLKLEFRRICDGENHFKCKLPFELIIADKKTNSEGLQLADLTARPIGLKIFRPNQDNRAAEVLEKKFCKDRTGNFRGVGLKIFPS